MCLIKWPVNVNSVYLRKTSAPVCQTVACICQGNYGPSWTKPNPHAFKSQNSCISFLFLYCMLLYLQYTVCCCVCVILSWLFLSVKALSSWGLCSQTGLHHFSLKNCSGISCSFCTVACVTVTAHRNDQGISCSELRGGVCAMETSR